MTYILVTDYSERSLAARVNGKILDGYTPLGGPYAVPDKSYGSPFIYYRHTQAMIKTEQ